MSKETDIRLLHTITSLIDRIRIQRFEEYQALGNKDDLITRNLRLKKTGGIEELKSLRQLIQETIESEPT